MTFEKGKCSNPKGINGRTPIKEALTILLSRPAGDLLNDKPKTIAQELAMNWIRDARLSNVDNGEARKEVAERVEGKPAQAIVGDSNADPIEIRTIDIRRILHETILEIRKQKDDTVPLQVGSTKLIEEKVKDET